MTYSLAKKAEREFRRYKNWLWSIGLKSQTTLGDASSGIVAYRRRKQKSPGDYVKKSITPTQDCSNMQKNWESRSVLPAIRRQPSVAPSFAPTSSALCSISTPDTREFRGNRS